MWDWFTRCSVLKRCKIGINPLSHPQKHPNTPYIQTFSHVVWTWINAYTVRIHTYIIEGRKWQITNVITKEGEYIVKIIIRMVKMEKKTVWKYFQTFCVNTKYLYTYSKKLHEKRSVLINTKRFFFFLPKQSREEEPRISSFPLCIFVSYWNVCAFVYIRSELQNYRENTVELNSLSFSMCKVCVCVCVRKSLAWSFSHFMIINTYMGFYGNCIYPHLYKFPVNAGWKLFAWCVYTFYNIISK